MADLPEIDEALETPQPPALKKSAYCIASWYPSEFEMINLWAMNTIRDRYGLPVGYRIIHSARRPGRSCRDGCEMYREVFHAGSDGFGSTMPRLFRPMSSSRWSSAFGRWRPLLGPALWGRRTFSSELDQRNVHRRSVVMTKAVQKGEVYEETWGSSVQGLVFSRNSTSFSVRQLPGIFRRKSYLNATILLNPALRFYSLGSN